MDKQLSKEETLNQFIDEVENDASCWTEETIYKAMDTYAKQEAIAFLIWCADNGWYRNGEIDEWYQIPKQEINKTTEQLYSLYQSK